jgi:hypothetical protein
MIAFMLMKANSLADRTALESNCHRRDHGGNNIVIFKAREGYRLSHEVGYRRSWSSVLAHVWDSSNLLPSSFQGVFSFFRIKTTVHVNFFLLLDLSLGWELWKSVCDLLEEIQLTN